MIIQFNIDYMSWEIAQKMMISWLFTYAHLFTEKNNEKG